MKRSFLAAAIIAVAGLLAAFAPAAHAQSITFTPELTKGNGKVTPKFTWSTAPAAASCTASGGWTGAKTAAGTETLPTMLKTALFTLSCAWPAASQITFKWIPPTVNTDGSALTNLAGYRLSYGGSPATLDKLVTIADPSATSYVLSGLTPGTWYASMTAYTTANAESDPTNVVNRALSSASQAESITVSVDPVPQTFTVTAE